MTFKYLNQHIKHLNGRLIISFTINSGCRLQKMEQILRIQLEVELWANFLKEFMEFLHFEIFYFLKQNLTNLLVVILNVTAYSIFGQSFFHAKDEHLIHFIFLFRVRKTLKSKLQHSIQHIWVLLVNFTRNKHEK